MPIVPSIHNRPYPSSQSFPIFDCEGTARACGEQLGAAWKDTLTLESTRFPTDHQPWWMQRRFARLVERHVPHLPELYRGMAAGAGIPETRVGQPMPVETGGCTSFALEPQVTLDKAPISGQSKDVAIRRGRELCILRMRLDAGPSALSLTYPGWLFGHGFVRGGTAIYRNSMYLDCRERGLPYLLWGLLALHCTTVDDVMQLTLDHGIDQCVHLTVADANGGVVGIEYGNGHATFLSPRDGIYAHANALMSTDPQTLALERDDTHFSRRDSLHRVRRFHALLDPERGRITPQTCYRAMCDHDGYPVSICRHQNAEAISAAIVIAEPTKGLLHVTRGLPCQNWPQSYRV